MSSFEDAARVGLAIFPALQFRCSGIVTHVSMSIRNRTQLCAVMQDKPLLEQAIAEYRVNLLVWERAGQDGQYRFLGQHRPAVVVKEVERQCRQQQEGPVVVQFALDINPASQLLVEPGHMIGFKYPFVYSIGGKVPEPRLDIEFVEATPGASLLIQGSQPAVNAIVAAKGTPFNVAPRVGFSIDGESVSSSVSR